MILPFVGLAIIAILVNFHYLYFLLIALLPVSIEYQFSNGFGTDLPTEPIAIGLMLATIVWIMINPSIARKQIMFKNPIVWFVLLHFMWALISVIFSSNHLVSIKYLAAKSWYIIVYFFLSMLVINSNKSFKRVSFLLVGVTFLSIIYVLIKHAAFGFSFDSINRSVVPIYRNHVNYGVFISAILPLMILTRYWTKKGAIERLAIDLIICTTIIAIYFTYTRGAWVGVFLALITLGMIRLKLLKVAVPAGLILAILFFSYMANNNTYLKYAPDYQKTIYHEDFSDHMSATFQMQDMSTVERFYRWIAGLKMIKENLVTGIGPSTFNQNYKSYTVSAYETYISENKEQSTIHNYFLLILVEQGILGLSIFLLLVLLILIYGESLYHRTKEREVKYIILAIMASLVVLLVNNLFSDLIEADKIGPLFFILSAILVSIGLKSNRFTTQKGKNLS